MSPPSERQAASYKTPSARVLFVAREEILATWVKRVKEKVKSAKQLANPVIVNTMPLFIERLADALDEELAGTVAPPATNVAQEHGGERARVTRYGPEQIIQEFQLLRDTVRETLSAQLTLTTRDESIIQQSFDVSLQESIVTYFLVHGRIREQLISTLTHDLREPLGAAKMAADLAAQMLGDGEAIDAETKSDLDMVVGTLRSNISRVDRMVRELIDSSVAQVGEKISLNIAADTMADVLKTVLADLDYGLSKRLVVTAESVAGYWDHRAFSRSIGSLITNIAEYSPGETKIYLSIKAAFGRVIVAVSNDEAVIPAPELETLFQAFLRSDIEEGGWGTGLGLTRATTEQMGGSLGVESSIEAGTRLAIDVPADTRGFITAPITS